MHKRHYLAERFPTIGRSLPTAGLCGNATPVTQHSLLAPGGTVEILVKHDERCGTVYGGNKVRKLDYILPRARQRNARAIATFGAVGSHHALATALYARALGCDALCFLGHQPATENVYATLSAHVANDTKIIRYGGTRKDRIALLRKYLHVQPTWVIPSGGSSWLGTVGFVDAALEFACQLDDAGLDPPARLYVANGTMGTAAGLALGLAIAGLPTELNAVRVTSEAYANRDNTLRLMRKVATLLNAIDPTFPKDIPEHANIRFRGQFVGDGYTRPTAACHEAMRIAADALALDLDQTYTGKAFAAVLADAENAGTSAFWNTYNALPLPQTEGLTLAMTGLPEDFARYFSDGSSSPESSSA